MRPRAIVALALLLLGAMALLGSARPRAAHAAPRQTDDASAATAVAQRLHPDAQLWGTGDCNAAAPVAGTLCMRLESTPEQLALGLARFDIFGVGDDGGSDLLGRTADGDWLFFQRTGQQTEWHTWKLPDAVRVCADGAALNVHTGPDVLAPIAGALPDGAIVTADRFVLYTSGSPFRYPDPAVAGDGWFHIDAPVAGWVYAPYTASAASIYDCQIRNGVARY